MQEKNQRILSELTEIILGCCFDVMNELGIGFLESVYKNALYVAMKEKGLNAETEKRFNVIFRGRKIGQYMAWFKFDQKWVTQSNQDPAHI